MGRGQDRDLVPGGSLGQRGEIRRSGGWRRQGEGPGGLAVEHEESLVVPVVDVDWAGVTALGEVVGHCEGPAGLRR
jgi:hypothetical protein